MVPMDKLAEITARFEYLEAKMSGGMSGSDIADLAREYSELRPVVAEIAAYRKLLDDLAETKALLADPDMVELAAEELNKIFRSPCCPRTRPMHVRQ